MKYSFISKSELEQQKLERLQAECLHIEIIKIQHGKFWYTKCKCCSLITDSDHIHSDIIHTETLID